MAAAGEGGSGGEGAGARLDLLAVFRHVVPQTQAFDFDAQFGSSVVLASAGAAAAEFAGGQGPVTDVHTMLRTATARRDEVRTALAGGNLLAAAQLILGASSDAGAAISAAASGAGAGAGAAAAGDSAASQNLTASGAWESQQAQQGASGVGQGGYLSWFMGLRAATDSAPASVLKNVRFIWSTPLGTRNAKNPLVDSSFAWEATMLCMTVGVCLRNLASERLAALVRSEREFADGAPQIATLLTRAAGVFAYTRDVVLVQWTTRPDGDSLPEAKEALYVGLEQLCLAEAQAVTAKKAECSGMAPALLAKLASGASDLFGAAHKTLAAIPGVNMKQYSQSAVQPQIVAYTDLSAKLWRSTAQELAARAAFDAQSVGPALALARAAVTSVPSISSSSVPTDLDKIRAKYAAAAKIAAATAARIEKENSTVYFDTVPATPDDVASRTLTKVTNFLPPPDPLAIELKTSDGSPCVIQ